MKRALSLALTALLLAGCTAAPTASGDAAASAEPAPSPAAAESTDTAEEAAATSEALRPLLPGDKTQYYMIEPTEGELFRYVVADLVNHITGVPCDIEGCTHDTETCPATFIRGESNAAFVLDENTLVAFTDTQSTADGGDKVILMDRNCQDRRVFTAGSDEIFYVQDGSCPAYTDGQYLYCFGYHGSFGVSPAIYRIDLETGVMTDLMADNRLPIDLFLGDAGRYFIFMSSDLTYPNPNADPTITVPNLPTGTITHYALDTATGEMRTLYTYTSDEWELSSLDAYVVDGQYYQIDRAAGTLSTLDPATGESRLITDGLPTASLDSYNGDYRIVANVNGWLLFNGLPILVNINDGEIRQRAELPENCWNDSGHQPNVYLNLGDTLLVDCRWEADTNTYIGSDGTPFTAEYSHVYLALISADDYLNGVPNYTEVGEYAS